MHLVAQQGLQQHRRCAWSAQHWPEAWPAASAWKVAPKRSLLCLRHPAGQRCRQVLRQLLEWFLAEWELTHVGWSVHSVKLNSLHRGPCDEACSPRHLSDQHGSLDQTQSNAEAGSSHRLLPAMHSASCRAHLPRQSSKHAQCDASNALPDEVHILAVAVLCEHLLGMSHGIGASCHGVGAWSGPRLQQSLHSIGSDTGAFPGRQKPNPKQYAMPVPMAIECKECLLRLWCDIAYALSMPSAELLHS